MTVGRRGRDDELHDEAPVDEELAQILSRARALPRDSQPERDLWPEVERRLSDVRSSPRPRAQAGEGSWWNRLRLPWRIREFGAVPAGPAWAAMASAALLLVVSTVFATLWWVGPTGAPPGLQQSAQTSLPKVPRSDEDARRIADTLRGRDGVSGVHESLLAIVAERREELPPQTVAVLEENLRIIDHAIAEIHHAMGGRTDSHALNLLLAETYRREVQLLNQLEWWSSVPEEKSS